MIFSLNTIDYILTREEDMWDFVVKQLKDQKNWYGVAGALLVVAGFFDGLNLFMMGAGALMALPVAFRAHDEYKETKES